jgi:hypothetical protein
MAKTDSTNLGPLKRMKRPSRSMSFPVLMILVGLSVTLLLAATVSPKRLPEALLGEWEVGTPYDARQPIGLDQSQEDTIKSTHLYYAPGHIRVCGKDIAIQSVKIESLTSDDFLSKYGFSPSLIGMKGSHVTEVSMNFPHFTNVCGQFADPGTHAFIGRNKHVVIEVENDYFPLRRPKVGDGKSS